MPNFLQVLLNNAQFVLFILVFLAPMIAGAVRWVQAQRDRRRRQLELERRRLEALRTGRLEPAPAPAPAPVRSGPTREEVAARRQREMQERLRQRLEQQRRAGQAQAPQTVPPRRPAPPTSQSPTVLTAPGVRTAPPRGAGRPPTAPGTPPGRGAAHSRPSPGPGRQFPQQERSRGQQRQTSRQAQPPAAERPPLGLVTQTIPVSPALQSSLGESVSREEIGSAREVASHGSGGPAVRIGGGLSVQRLREAVVMREVLDPPLALRQADPAAFS